MCRVKVLHFLKVLVVAVSSVASMYCTFSRMTLQLFSVISIPMIVATAVRIALPRAGSNLNSRRSSTPQYATASHAPPPLRPRDSPRTSTMFFV